MSNDLKTYHCTILKENVTDLVCDARRQKANISLHNKRFKHKMTERQLKGCRQCKERPRGLTTLRKAEV